MLIICFLAVPVRECCCPTHLVLWGWVWSLTKSPSVLQAAPQPSARIFWCSPASFGVHTLTRGVLPPHCFMEHSDLGRTEYCEQPEESPVGSHTQPGPKQAASGPFCTMRHLIKEMASQGKMFYGCFYKIQFKLQFIFCGSLQIDG